MPDQPPIPPTPFDVARQIEAWRQIAHSETGTPNITMSRATLALLFDGLDTTRHQLTTDLAQLRLRAEHAEALLRQAEHVECGCLGSLLQEWAA